jgi:hypothetical protein
MGANSRERKEILPFIVPNSADRGYPPIRLAVLLTILVVQLVGQQARAQGGPYTTGTHLSADELRQLPVQPAPPAGCGGSLLPCPIEDIPWNTTKGTELGVPLPTSDTGTLTISDMANTWISTRGDGHGFWTTISQADQDLIDARAICADHRPYRDFDRPWAREIPDRLAGVSLLLNKLHNALSASDTVSQKPDPPRVDIQVFNGRHSSPGAPQSEISIVPGLGKFPIVSPA